MNALLWIFVTVSGLAALAVLCLLGALAILAWDERRQAREHYRQFTRRLYARVIEHKGPHA